MKSDNDSDVTLGSGAASDAEAQRLLEECIDRLIAGERVDLEALAREHPGVGREVVLQLRTFEGFEDEPEAPRVGALGDYTLRRQIGRGGMGVVYEAWQGSLDRHVALKVLPAGIAADNKSFVRFMREAKTAAQLNHPNVVGVYGVGVESDTPYFSMEYVDGETLAGLLGRMRDADPDIETPFGPRNDVRFAVHLAEAFAVVADGLQHAHSKGVVHRDIKPSNLILDRERRLRILDFGLARIEGQESITLSGDVMGTVLYMSPEQAMVKRIPLDHRTDIYSLGATMYEALTGEPPFRGKDQHDTLSQIIARDPWPPRQLNSTIPTDLETVVLKCLRKDPLDRYGTAEALSQDLRRVVRGDPVEARPEDAWDRLRRRLWRNRRRVVIGAVVALLLGVSGFLALRLAGARHAETEAEYERRVVVASLKLLRGEYAAPAGLGRPNEAGVFLSSYYSQSLGDIGRRSIESALSELRDLTELLPDRHEAWYHLARGLALLGREEEALGAARRCLEEHSGFAPAMVLLARMEKGSPTPTLTGWGEIWQRADTASRTTKWKEAVAGWGELIALEDAGGEKPPLGSEIEYRFRRGIALLERKEPDDLSRAVSDFSVADALARDYDPRIIEPRLAHGLALELDGKVEHAKSVFDDALAAGAHGDDPRLWVGAVYASLIRRQHYTDLDGTRLLQMVRRALDVRDDLNMRRLVAGAFLRVIRRRRADAPDHEQLVRELSTLAESTYLQAPDDPARMDLLSRSLEVQGELERAHELHLRALEKEAQQRHDAPQGESDMNTLSLPAAAAIVAATSLASAQGPEGFFEVEGRVMAPSCLNDNSFVFNLALSGDGSRLAYGASTPDLWMATIDEEWGDFRNCRALSEISSPLWDTPRSFSADGRELWFESTRLNGGEFRHNFFRAVLDESTETFGPPTHVPDLDAIGVTNRISSPYISKSGLELYFHQVITPRNRDMWVAWRESLDESFSPERARPLEEINSGFDEFTPVLSSDGTTLLWTGFRTNSHLGGTDWGSSNVWMSTRPAPYDPMVHTEPPRFGTVRVLPADPPGTHFYSIAVPDAWPLEGSKVYFVSCLPGQCSQGGEVFDIYSAIWHATPTAVRFRRGDCNGDGQVNLSDAACALGWLFEGHIDPACLAALDTNGDDQVNLTDPVALLNFLFAGGDAAVVPYPDCGAGEGELGCERYPGCR